jgi:hypothetical protein
MRPLDQQKKLELVDASTGPSWYAYKTAKLMRKVVPLTLPAQNVSLIELRSAKVDADVKMPLRRSKEWW